MKKKLTNNLFLKIISVMIAILVWLLIANINDPVITKTYNIPVTIQNSAYIESISKTYRVEAEDQTVTVILRGHSSLVENRSNDVQAVANLTQIVDMNTKPYVMVPITVTCKGLEAENITVIPQNMKVVIEEIESQEFVIGITTTGGNPDSEYRIGPDSLAANPAKVTILGPASLIQKIDSVTATVDVSYLKMDTVKECDLTVFDKNGDELTENQMSYLKFKNMEEPTVDVQVSLWKVRNDVSLEVHYSGSPGSGYEVTDILTTPAKINVAGTEEALQLLRTNNNTIVIPAEAVVLSGETEDFETTIDLSKYLPEDTILASDAQSAIVHVSIMPSGSKQFTVSTKNIKGTNLDERYKAVYETDKLTVRVTGDPEALTKVNENTVKPVIDFQGVEPGTSELPVQITLPEGCTLLEDVTVSVQIMELE